MMTPSVQILNAEVMSVKNEVQSHTVSTMQRSYTEEQKSFVNCWRICRITLNACLIFSLYLLIL